MKISTSKIILGGAQLGSSYGITNRQKKMSGEESKKLIIKAKKSKIRFIDLAFSYNNFNSFISEKNLKYFKIINKIEFKNNLSNSDLKKIENKIIINLNRLKKKSYYALLIHNTEQLNISTYKKVILFLNYIKKIKLTKKIGISIYDIRNIKKFYDLSKFELVQFPYNFLDRRIENDGILSFIKKKKIESHARSIFMQGILLCDMNTFPSKLNKYILSFKKYIHCLEHNKISHLEACLSLINTKKIDKFVIGFRSQNELNSILSTDLKKFYKIENIPKINNNLINPHKW